MHIIKAPVEDMFGDVQGFLQFLYTPIVTLALKHNGYIAGGFARNMLATKCVDPMYFVNGGDIDVFFYCEEDYLATLAGIVEYTKNIYPHVIEENIARDSIAKFAKNIQTPIWFDGYSHVTVKVQLVNSHFGTPEEILKSFDLVNSIVAFNFENGWVSDCFKQLEERSQIMICGSSHIESLGGRVGKYFKKYGYTTMDEASHKTLAKWAKKYTSPEFLIPRSSRIYRNPQTGHVEIEPSEPKLFVNQNKAAEYLKNCQNLSDDLLPNFVGLSTTKVRVTDSGEYIEQSCSYGYTIDIDTVLFMLSRHNVDQKIIAAAHERLYIIERKKAELNAERRAQSLTTTLLNAGSELYKLFK